MDKIVIFVLCFCYCYAKITIKNLAVPSSISVEENGVILDCDYDSQGDVVDEVRWFLNGKDVIYQWLPQTKRKPSVLANFTENIDVSYKATDDNNTMYRAIRIVKLSPKLSGDYMCKVSGDNSEDAKTKRMIIYDPADSDLDVNVIEDYSESNSTEDVSVAIFCDAEGLHPKPDLKISVSNDNETEIKFLREEEDFDIDEDGLYNISTIVFYNPDDLPKTFYYTCELTIPGTTYQLNETEQHTLESDTDTRFEIEEDYSNLLNSTNSTEVFEEPQENASIRHSPSLSLLSTVLIIAALGPLYYL